MVFTSALALKSFHYHNLSSQVSGTSAAVHHASVKQACNICEFTMHKALEAHSSVFLPMTIMKWTDRPMLSELTVYRIVTSINTHSPPSLG